jgi:hypothetical protein
MARRPACVIVTGRPGAGKTTLAGKLAERLWMPVVSRDAIKEGYVNTQGISHDWLPVDSNVRISDLFFDLVHYHLTGGVSVVIEAAFQHAVWTAHLPRIAAIARPVFVICSLDADLADRRHLHRGLDLPARVFYHGDQRVQHFLETGDVLAPGGYEPPACDAPVIEVCTTDGYTPSLDEVVASISGFVRNNPERASP